MWWHKGGFHAGFRFGLPPYFFFFGSRPPSKEDYARMLEEHKKGLEKELQELDKELAELRKS